MQKYFRLSKLSQIIPEAIALSIVFSITQPIVLPNICLLLLIYSAILRLIWNSAIAIHGLGHTVAISLADRDLSAINLTNILEHRSITESLNSLLPFQPIFVPYCDRSNALRLDSGKPQHIRIKSAGGIFFNFIVAIVFSGYGDSLFVRNVVTANLLIACSSLSDIEAFATGVADYLYCGNFGLIAQRKPDEKQKLLPDRMLDIALQMGQETEVRGEQAGGGLVIGKNNNFTVFVGKKIVNRKRANLTQSLETAFAAIRNKAIAAGIKPLESTVTGVWHYRYATSGTAPSELETHWHEWMGKRERKVWRFTGREWLCETKNVHHRITHNGDFDSWQIFNRDVDNSILGLWLERVLHTPNATKGDSPKIAGMMDLLVTQGMWYPSVRLAYQQAIAISIEEAFDGQKPTVNAPNTAPSPDDLNTWAKIFESTFIAELSRLKPSDAEQIIPNRLKLLDTLRQDLIKALKKHSSTKSLSKLQTTCFIQFTLQAFFDNDLYRATQIFIKQAKGSFGLVTVSTLEESELVLCAKGQPISIGFNWSQGYMVYASEPAAVDRILLNKPQSFRLDLEQSGEVAKASAKNIKIYSLTLQQELQVLQLQSRWISMTDNPHLSHIKFAQSQIDPVAQDINSIPKILHNIKTDWENPTSLNRRSADYLTYLLTEKVQRFEKKQRLMFKAGLISKIRTMPTVDLLITGEENSLWIGEKFARDLKVVFPFLNVVTISANEILQQLDRGFGQLNLGKDSLILAITQSGQTFSTVQIINVFDHLSSQGTIGELFILTGELSSFINSTEGKGGLTTISRSSFVDNDNHRYRIFINGSDRRTAEPSTATVAAALQTLTELLFYLAKQMRSDFPHCDPLGMTLTTESLMVLGMMKEDFLNRNILYIIGTDTKGKPLSSTTKQALVEHGHYWANHVTETPLAWAIQALYIIVSVGWAIPFGHTLPLVKTLSGSLFNLLGFWPELTAFLTPAIAIADIGVYIFGAWVWTLIIRCCQGRQILARTGKRTLVIGDITWIDRLLQAYVSKLFSLSYGIATIEVHSANPQNNLLHSFGHRVVRGTLIWLGIPDGRRSPEQQAAENAVIMTGKQANGVRNFNIGAEIVAIGNNPQISQQGFSQSIVLDSNNDAIYFRNAAVAEQKEQIEALRESCFGSFERLLSSYVFFWAMAKKVASFPFLKYEYWKSQSRTKVMTTASPVGGFNISKLHREKAQRSAHLEKYANNNRDRI